MSPVPLRHRPAFRALLFAVVLVATWIYDYAFRDDRSASLAGIALDLVLLLLLFPACLFIYGQFTLPVRNLQDRMRVFGRLLLRARNAHGAAIFVQNGRKVERRGESGRAGPGLLWIDTASAAITRAGTGPKQVLGPGIHFLRAGDRVDATFSLHPQMYSMGPSQDEPVFERLPEEASEEQRQRYASTQARRQAVSGLTRDGNEVIPEIRVVFKLEGTPAGPGQPGSHFGFDPDAVARAALGEGVTVDPVSARRSAVAWNQLPGLIAADLWREYLAKFTLDELFTARFDAVPDVPQPQERLAESANVVTPPRVRPDSLAPLLRRLNDLIEVLADEASYPRARRSWAAPLQPYSGSIANGWRTRVHRPSDHRPHGEMSDDTGVGGCPG